jgi:hypothetical protein
MPMSACSLLERKSMAYSVLLMNHPKLQRFADKSLLAMDSHEYE